ncbi:hypothetical protein JX266_014065, partial [Neoarthrinium moseri]
MLRDQLYPVKVNNVNRTAVLDEQGIVLLGAEEVLGQENDVQIAKISWLSNKENGKAYGSMAVYVTKGSDASKVLVGQYFNVAGESAYTKLCAADAHGKSITTETARQQTRSAYYAVAHTSPPAGPAEGCILRPMDHNFRTLQLNRTERLWNHSDTGTKRTKDRQRNYIGANEARKLDENATDDSTRREVPVRNANVTAALVKVADRVVLIASVYMPSNDAVASHEMIGQLRDLGRQASHSTDYLYIGDFKLHDQVWGGDGVSQARQGEADHLIDMMNELGLMSLLPKGTKMWQRDGRETTIDLVLTSEGLARDTIACGIHPTEHGSDHRAIEATFGTRMPV